MRAKFVEQLYDRVRPVFFFEWAKANGIEYPQELEMLVTARRGALRDWKSAYDDLKTEYENLVVTLQNNTDAHEVEVRTLSEERDALKERLAALEAANHEASKTDQLIGVREQDSLLKLVIGMAIQQYIYDPKAKRNKAVPNIAEDLALSGVPLDPDTVRKWLKIASEIVPGEFRDEDRTKD